MFSSLGILVCIIFMLYIVNITRVNAQLCKLIKDRMLNLQCCTRLFMEKALYFSKNLWKTEMRHFLCTSIHKIPSDVSLHSVAILVTFQGQYSSFIIGRNGERPKPTAKFKCQ